MVSPISPHGLNTLTLTIYLSTSGNHCRIMKCARGVDGMCSFVLKQALYETRNEWVGNRVS